jgi:hypothetical protein
MPRAHAFEYRLFMSWLDLAELDMVFKDRWLWSTQRPAPAWFRRADYLGDPQVPLDRAVRDRVEQESGIRLAGPIRMLTHLRSFGLCFNPVTFYYCYNVADTRVETIVAEITNTPWNERHAYVLTDRMNEGNGDAKRYRFSKRFHVSPFMDMAIDYDWRFSAPGAQLNVHMEDHKDGQKLFDATLNLQRHEISATSLAYVLVAFPFITAKVISGIYWQALRLWLKGVPFYTHPNRITDTASARPARSP